ncbi:MAG: hypothetical protein ABSD72_15940 [Terracidiphilus sp.]
MKIRIPLLIAQTAIGAALMSAATFAIAQTPVRFVGTITAINGNTLSVKTDADGAHQVNVPATAVLKSIAPGRKDLSTAVTIFFSDLAIGDRALVKLDPGAPAGTEEALQIIAVKQADLALKQQKDREDWQQRGAGGLVKSVDTSSGVILLTSGVGATARIVTVNTTKATILKRYAPDSVRFDAALPAPIGAISPGDQLRARGAKNADGTEIAAEEVVSGSFRNVSGTILSLDAASSTLVVNDLATKKPVTIHITPDAQMRNLPEMMAKMLAARLKGGTAGGAASSQQSRAPSMTGGGRGAGDPQQMLNRAPAIQLADLKKGDAVMLVSTAGTTEVTAITLLAGVEPLLEAPAASQNMLSNWSMNTAAPDVAQ